MTFQTRWPWLFDQMFRPEEFFRATQPPGGSLGVYPPLSLFDDGRSFRVRAEMPGVKKETLEVTAKGDQLSISGERATEPAAPEAVCRLCECQGGPFRRTLTLPEPVDAENIEATYRNGVLEVVLPRPPQSFPRRINVQ